MYTNDFGEKFFVNCSSYDILTTDSKKYDRVINPFDLNITKNNPYNDEEKNKSCFLGIESKNEKVLLIFKTKEIPNFDEMFELYYNYNTDSYDITYNHDYLNKDNQLVVAYGTSIIILDINTYKVINYVSSEAIDRYAINIFYRENFI